MANVGSYLPITATHFYHDLSPEHAQHGPSPEQRLRSLAIRHCIRYDVVYREEEDQGENSAG